MNAGPLRSSQEVIDLCDFCLFVGAGMSILFLVCPLVEESCRPILATIMAVCTLAGAIAAKLPDD